MASGLKQRAYAHIRDKLLRGDFQPGRGLSNRALARELGISPVPVREAICQLEAEGVLEQRPWSGTYPKTLSREEWVHLFELRQVLEGNAASHAATRITPAQIEVCQTQCDFFQRFIDELIAGKYTQFEGELARRMSVCDYTFHKTVFQAARNPMALKIIEQFQILGRMYEAMCFLVVPVDEQLLARHRETQMQHLEILNAVRAGDGEAARDAAFRHFECGMKWVLYDLDRQAQLQNSAG